MKTLVLFISILLFVSCEGGTKKKKLKVKTKEIEAFNGPNYESISNCLTTTLSYKLQIEPRDYDSIATYYFHEIRDYIDIKIRKKNQRLRRLKEWYKDSSMVTPEIRLKEIEKEIDVLQQDVNRYYREVIGYVFVHSFRIKEKDTMSAIFVMDQNCSFKELIKVKVITDPNPDDYIESIRSIEH